MKTIQINEWTLTKQEDKSEPLIQDLELATKLGYASPVTIKKLIKRMVDAGQLGVVSTVGNGEVGGRAGLNYFLDERQSLKIIARSKTDVADKILDEVIEVYLAYRRGQLPASTESTRDLALAKLKEAIAEKQEWAIRLALELNPNTPRAFARAPLQLPAKPAEPAEEDLDDRLRAFLLRWYLEDPASSVSVSSMQHTFNATHWRSRPVLFVPLSDALARLLPGRVQRSGGDSRVLGICERKVQS